MHYTDAMHAVDWIELPGLFTRAEFAEVSGLEVVARPLVVRDGEVYFGLYVRLSLSKMTEKAA